MTWHIEIQSKDREVEKLKLGQSEISLNFISVFICMLFVYLLILSFIHRVGMKESYILYTILDRIEAETMPSCKFK